MQILRAVIVKLSKRSDRVLEEKEHKIAELLRMNRGLEQEQQRWSERVDKLEHLRELESVQLNMADTELELTQTFLSGRKAVIAVSSPGGTAPALRVVSASGKTVCDSAASCRWTPVFTERYPIILQNTSRKARAYYLVVE